MASQSITKNNGVQLNVNTYRPATFLGNNDTLNGQYVNNSSYNPISLVAGTVMARVATTGVLVPWHSLGNNGTNIPVGLLCDDRSIDAGATTVATLVISGEVAEEQVVCFYPGDTLETVVDNRRLRDRLAGDTAGIILRPTEDNTEFSS